MVTKSSTPTVLDRVIDYLRSYVAFSSDDYVLAGALWTIATHLWPSFDAFPYMVITSATKRSGKTRFSELLSFTCANSMNVAGATAATVFRSIEENQPTIFMDEAEGQGSETADMMRTILNVGYRRGQTVPRVTKTGVHHYPVYCPKCFILIGDVRDTLRDRSIVIQMRRSDAPKRFLWADAEALGNELRDEIHETLTEAKNKVMEAYTGHLGLEFLPDRDEEIWLPLFAVCAVIAPERMIELQRVAVDLATEKTVAARKVSSEELRAAEEAATSQEYGARLVADLRTVLGSKKFIVTAEVVDALKALPTAPWRKYRGAGLDANMLAALVAPFGVRPKNARLTGKGKGGHWTDNKVRKAYFLDNVLTAIREHKLG